MTHAAGRILEGVCIGAAMPYLLLGDSMYGVCPLLAGFLKQFIGVCQPHHPHKYLAAVLTQLSGGRKPSRVLCCGHSLGGALATLGKASLTRVRSSTLEALSEVM